MRLNNIIHWLFMGSSLGAATKPASSGKEPKGHEYHRDDTRNSRSPCPGLNSLANHGYLPRSGRDIDLAAVQKATREGFNMVLPSHEQAVPLVLGLGLSTTATPNKTFNLHDLGSAKAHGTVEFDGSHSRSDFNLDGDALHFNATIFAAMVARLRLYHDEMEWGGPLVTIEAAAKARAARSADAKMANPWFNASDFQTQGTLGTTVLYLSAMWDWSAGAARKQWVRAFFEEERIPFREGYKTPTQVTDDSVFFSRFNEAAAVPV